MLLSKVIQIMMSGLVKWIFDMQNVAWAPLQSANCDNTWAKFRIYVLWRSLGESIWKVIDLGWQFAFPASALLSLLLMPSPAQQNKFLFLPKPQDRWSERDWNTLGFMCRHIIIIVVKQKVRLFSDFFFYFLPDFNFLLILYYLESLKNKVE